LRPRPIDVAGRPLLSESSNRDQQPAHPTFERRPPQCSARDPNVTSAHRTPPHRTGCPPRAAGRPLPRCNSVGNAFAPVEQDRSAEDSQGKRAESFRRSPESAACTFPSYDAFDVFSETFPARE
jgi:hypothetical protein